MPVTNGNAQKEARGGDGGGDSGFGGGGSSGEGGSGVGLVPVDGVEEGSGESAANNNRKNYKNMTRVRRVEANARERTRVHTIGAAFDALRHAVPSYSFNQKLSKLAILRVASSYIMTLGRMLGREEYETNEGEQFSVAECVELVGKTIQTEGRIRRRSREDAEARGGGGGGADKGKRGGGGGEGDGGGVGCKGREGGGGAGGGVRRGRTDEGNAGGHVGWTSGGQDQELQMSRTET